MLTSETIPETSGKELFLTNEHNEKQSVAMGDALNTQQSCDLLGCKSMTQLFDDWRDYGNKIRNESYINMQLQYCM